MTYQLIVRDEAQKDIAEIIRWYESKDIGLGDYFLLCLDASLEAMRRYPTAPRIIRHEYRRVFIRKFPVGVYYIVRENTIFVDAVEPFPRNPNRLGDKLKNS